MQLSTTVVAVAAGSGSFIMNQVCPRISFSSPFAIGVCCDSFDKSDIPYSTAEKRKKRKGVRNAL
jgi:hypothetical protein